MAVAGIDAGGTSFKAVLMNEAGEIAARERIATTNPDAMTEALASWIDGLRDAGHAIEAIGFASFGPIDRDPASESWGEMGVTPKAGWQGSNLRKALHRATGIPCALDTDVNGALMAEAQMGAGMDVDDLAYVTIGTGVGGAALVGGNLVGAPRHGEFGHIRFHRSPENIAAFAGSCPFHGDCVEGIATSGAIRARWGAEPDQLPDDHPAWIEEADALAQLALAIAYLDAPQRIVMGGGLMLRRGLIDAIRRRFDELLAGYAPRPEMRDAQSYLVLPGLGEDAGAIGGAMIARRHFG